jgi:hypothetical protein
MMHSMLFFWHRYELPAIYLDQGRADHFSHIHVPIPLPPVISPVQLIDDRNVPNDSVREQEQSSPQVSSGPSPVPLPNFDRMNVGRTQSFNTVASGRLSRNSSNYGLYNRGDEDDEGSYMYFMGGEVVIPRPSNDHSNNNSEHSRLRATSPYNTTSEFVPPPTNPTSRATSSASSLSLSSTAAAIGLIDNSESSRSRRERFVNELEPVVASAFSMDEDSDIVRNTNDVTPDSASHSMDEDMLDGLHLEDNNTSSLQAILNVMDEGDLHTLNQDGFDGVDSTTQLNAVFR